MQISVQWLHSWQMPWNKNLIWDIGEFWLVFEYKVFFTISHDKFVARKFLVCMVQALENQIFTVIWSLPSSFFTGNT